MDAQSLRRVLHDFFKFNPKDFFVQGSGTGFLVSSTHRSSTNTAIAKYGFRWFPAPKQDGVDPTTQSRLVQFDEGVINESIVPDNMASTFELPNNQQSYLRCTTTQTATGVVSTAQLDITTELLPDPEGSLGVAPATSSRPLWFFDVQENKIVNDIALRVGGIEVTPVVVGMDCSSVLLKMFWGPAQNIVVVPPPDA